MTGWVQIARYAHPSKGGLSIVFLLMLIAVGLEVLKPWPLKLIVDYVLKGKPLPDSISGIGSLPAGGTPLGLLGWFSAGTVLVFLAHRLTSTIRGYARAGVGMRMTYNLGWSLFDYLQRLSLRFHSRHQTGDLVRRVTTDSGCIRELILGAFMPALASLFNLAAMFVVMWKLDRSLALLSILVAPVLILFIRLFSGPMMERTYRHQQIEGKMMSLAEQTLTAIPLVQSFGREDDADRKWGGLSQSSFRAYLGTILSQMQFKIGVSGTTALGAAMVMAVGGFHVIRGSLTVGSLIVFLSYVTALYAPMETLAYLFTSFASATARARRVIEILEVQDRVQETPDAVPFPVPVG
ncbi:MAG: ABC transporter ATP-binding protein, partial [Desulfobacteraceae bacterium]